MTLLNLNMQVRITIKSNESSRKLEIPISHFSNVSSHAQLHVQIKHSLACLQDLLPTVADVVVYICTYVYFIPAKVFVYRHVKLECIICMYVHAATWLTGF